MKNKNKKTNYKKLNHTDILQRKIKTMQYGKEYFENIEESNNTK